MTVTIRMVISEIPLAPEIPSTGRVAVIVPQTPFSEMTVTIRKVISEIPLAPENPSTVRVAVIVPQTHPREMTVTARKVISGLGCHSGFGAFLVVFILGRALRTLRGLLTGLSTGY